MLINENQKVKNHFTVYTWTNCWNQKTYMGCKSQFGYPFYPAMGIILSVGAMHTIRSVFDTFQSGMVHLIFRYYLAFFDALNFLLLVWLASLMRFRFPIFVGLILLIIPSTWTGTAVWGQLDGILLFFCLLSAISFFKSWSISDSIAETKQAWKSGIYLLLGTFSLVCYILMKQTVIFSLPFFFLIILITVWKFWKCFSNQGIFWLVLALIVFIENSSKFASY